MLAKIEDNYGFLIESDNIFAFLFEFSSFFDHRQPDYC